MANDIFKNTQMNYGGGFKSNVGIINSVGGKLKGVLMQNLAWTYAQEMQRLYELGPDSNQAAFYYLSGRANGQMQIGHILGPGVQLRQYYTDFSDVCNAAANTVRVNLHNSDCRRDTRIADLKFCVLVQVGQSAQVPSLQINEGSSLMFGNCGYDEDVGAANPLGAASPLAA